VISRREEFASGGRIPARIWFMSRDKYEAVVCVAGIHPTRHAGVCVAGIQGFRFLTGKFLIKFLMDPG
jgi:hypothetical protein